ncbi:class I mannose-6-phosphate isomerase [Clostridium swellfunianum]|uniref:class I mannose-6-phosphate isomerase n=1 Tax=Clostridium swellfunianum TaxID=1367462 RepID=UPI00202EC82A|nr:class I mannose-6-phosphate isomerase [Clostridium swellfunianum]
MKYIQHESNYDKYPEISIKGFDTEAWSGYNSILQEVKIRIEKNNKAKTVVAIECYPGVRYEELYKEFISHLGAKLIVNSDEAALYGDELTSLIDKNLTEDRVFGLMCHMDLKELFIQDKLENIKNRVEEVQEGLVVVYGVGATLAVEGDILLYCDLARWEIQQRYRSGEIGNWRCDNNKEDVLRKYKRGFFVEWRLADKVKKSLYEKIDYLIDTNQKNAPNMITGRAFLEGLRGAALRPFRLVPYFDPGVWGGQWMKEVCNLDKDKSNFAWSFDGVPEENSIYLRYGSVRIEVPSINLVFYQPTELLGDKVHARFGTEFPIRFDFLDTIGGQNLSLQVHPLTEYIQEKFGMNYTQDESYYILDTEGETCVYLGTKEGINKEDMISDLRRAEAGEISFPDEKYINKFPAQKHDHFLIPAGTIHCSGTNSMVLEISATPYIFTFKLWDWDRVGLDGLPRPVHIGHGEKVIQWNRDTQWVKKNLINRIEKIDEGDGWLEERTGLHEREFIETRRHWFSKKVLNNTNGGVNVLNLIEGECALVESPCNVFEPFEVHYAETFIIPASVGEYTIRPYGNSEGKTIATIKAFVRT